MLDATPLLRGYAAYRNAQLKRIKPAECQEQQLMRLVKLAAGTKFGVDHAFAEIRSVSDYQSRVPLRRYEHFWTDYWKPAFPRLVDCTWPGTIPFYAVSSGTSSGTTKYLPLSQQMIRSNSKAALDLLVYHLNSCPSSKLFSGRSFFLGGSSDLVEEAPGIFSGDLSGITVKQLPWWARPRYFPPQDLALLKDWERKIEILAERSLSAEITMLSGVPAWMLILVNKLSQLRPESSGRISGIYPRLELLVHGGVNFAPYYEQFTQILAGSRAELREVYPASEGYIATADRGYGEGLRVNLDNSIFFEFVPLEELDRQNPTRHWIRSIELNVNYAVVLSTCAGLWSYVLGDTVKFVDRDVPRLLVTGRTSYYLSAFGEHLIAEEIEDGIATAAARIHASVSDYSVGAVYPTSPGDLGGHLYVIEFSSGAPSSEELQTFCDQLDRRLCQRNEDYAAHRANGFGLKAPVVKSVAPGTFSAWMKSRGKLGGQHKVPRIITDQKLFNQLVEFNGLRL